MAIVWTRDLETVSDSVLVGRVEALTFSAREPLHASLLDMLGGLSRQILQDPATRGMPQYVSLAYWLRPASLARLSGQLGQADAVGFVRAPRGIALHLPPTNVDTIFVYSWAMSVLAGNANVVRLPERLAPETQSLLSVVTRVVAEYREADRHLFCHYDYGGETEQALARHTDLRMIWGGDAKVASVSRVPIRPDGLSIGFPDRQSLAIIASDAYGNADAAARDALAGNFFNDVFWFDQMGCGSPRLLVWLGEPGALAEDFYARLQRAIERHAYKVETSVAIGKFILANNLLAEGVASGYAALGNAFHICRTDQPAAAIGRTHGGGFLCDWVARSLEEISLLATRKVQTLTYFGLSTDERSLLAKEIRGRGGYRLVPIGEALKFDPVWDGIDLYEHMTRRILVR